MTDELKLTAEYKGYIISWAQWGKHWIVEMDGKLEKQGFASPDKAQEWVDTQTKRKFKRVDVLVKEGWRSGQSFLPGIATSIDEDGHQAWVSIGAQRSKHGIESLFLATPENLAVVARLAVLSGNIRMLEEEMEKEVTKFTKLTPEMMVAHD